MFIRERLKDSLFHNIRRDEGSTVFWIAFALVITIGFAFSTDIGNAYTIKMSVHNTLENALLSSGTLWAKDNGTAPMDPTVMRTNFNIYLQKGLHLDSNNNPLAGSPVGSQVIVEQFRVINTVPEINNPIKHDTVTKPSIEAVISTTVPMYMSKLFSATPLTLKEYARVSIVP